MQFHAARRTSDQGGATSTTGASASASAAGSARRVDDESVLLLPLQPGRLLALKQHQHQLQHRHAGGSESPAAGGGKKVPSSNQRGADGKTAAAAVAPPPRASKPVAATTREPIDYLKLRRTDESARALHRNRAQHVVAHEILQPSASSPTLSSSLSSPPKKPPSIAEQSLADRLEALQRVDHALAELQSQVLSSHGKANAGHGASGPLSAEADSSAQLASQLQQLYRQQAQVQKESEAAARQVQSLLTVVRNDISLMHKFTPLFKIYARHKTKSAWHRWVEFVAWHREEQARLALLWPYAVTIQRVFRMKRSRWQRARMRMALAWHHWQSSACIQRAVRGWLGRRERDRLAEAREATKLQAAWRGRRDRRFVKKLLQNHLRLMLRSLTPTGNLHRLHEVMQRNPELSRPLNAMLSLIEETIVAVDHDATYKAKNAHIAAKIASRPVEATRRQLFHAVFELSEIIRVRERAVQAAKAAHNAKQEEKLKRTQQQKDLIKATKLQMTREKIAAEIENMKMRHEEMLTREYLRMLKTADTDRILRLKLDQSRREHADNARMVIEEYQTRYLVSEIRRRRLEDDKRLREVERHQHLLRERDLENTRQLMELLKTDEMKRNEIRTKQLQAEAEENELWSKMSKEQQAEAMRRLELREQMEEEERQRSDAILHEQQAQQRGLNRRREESRRQKQAELERELAAREMMDREDKLSNKAHLEQKKAMHADTWKAKREKEQVRYSLDPMHFSKIQAMKEQEERERRERYLMKLEEGIMIQIHEKERKEKYFEMCRQRRKQEKAESIRAEKERAMMHHEDSMADEIRAAERKAEEYKALRAKMAALAKQDEMKKFQRALEARNRKEMHDEEMRQRRVALAIHLSNELRETREREAMAQEEIKTTSLEHHVKKKADKRFREQCIFRMMREDVASMERQDWEEEGHRLEQLLWAPEDAATFSCLVTDYTKFLAINVAIVKELCGLKGPPPFNFDYEAVQRHRRDEASLPLDKVPRKKRKPRKFFYHEFFEDDPILSKLKPPPPPPSKARQRWKRLAEHFFGEARSYDSVRKAYLLMSDHKYSDATVALLEAVRMAEASSSHQTFMSLFRQVARCYLKYWEICFERTCLEKSLFYFQRATSSIGALADARFLQEIACVLEKSGRYREAAEVIAGIIKCFPRYSQLNEVIFRGGIVMISLGMYQQSREYLLHTLEASPFGWEQHEVLLLTARVMQFEGKPRRKLCSVAYEEAFRNNKRDAYYRLYPTWQEWIKHASTWRDIGDRYYAKKEFVLARDAYHVMMKRILKVKSHHGNLKRQQVLEAQRAVAQGDSLDTSHAMDDNDWLRVARCAAVLNDREAAVSALGRWFARKAYRERVLEQFYKWPLARWKLLGVEVPERVMEVLAQKKKEAEEEEAAKLKAVEARRLSVHRQRSVKARERLIAWPEVLSVNVSADAAQPAEPTGGTSRTEAFPVQALDHDEQSGAPLRIADEDKGDVYYGNDDVGEVMWDPRTIA